MSSHVSGRLPLAFGGTRREGAAAEARDRKRALLAVTFTCVLAVMLAHEAEHVAQILQKDALGATCPNDCRGLLGFAFDLEWVHVAYNHTLLLALAAMYVVFGLWRAEWRRRNVVAWACLTAGVFVVQGYHVVEHSVKLDQWLANGHRSPTPGILGMHVSLVELHFVMNTAVFLLVVPAYFAFGLHRELWARRSPARLALAAALVAAVLIGTGALWSQRPPTVHLEAGVHRGPIVLDHAQRLVGEPGTVVRGGIRVTADDVVVRDLAVSGGENGIEIDGAEQVVLERVAVRGVELDGIHARRAAVAIRDCRIDMRGKRYGQGIDISFAFDLPLSVVTGCAVTGGMQGIVSHFSHVHVRKNVIRSTALHAIGITEMSDASVERNDVRRARGIGIYCGDYSVCKIEQNTVSGMLADPASGDRARMGHGIVARFGAIANLADNRLERGTRPPAAFLKSEIRRS
jgi:hypothetical protein